jgi:plasmid maintenance system antidote protein VapI
MAEEKKLNPTALTVEKAAQALGVGRQTLEADIAAGAPVNADGTLNLVHYAACGST